MIELSPPEVLQFPSLSRTAVDPVDALMHRHDAETCAALGASAQNRELDVRASGSRVEARQRSADRKSPAGVDVVMISAPATIPDAMGPVRFGASGRLSQPVQIRQLSELADGAPQRPRLSAEDPDRIGDSKKRSRCGSMVGSSPVMQHVYQCIERVAGTDETVFLTGPTGTGKEVAAATIHAMSHRKNRAFVAVNCGAIAASLIESEFFGHERGAFTGADKQRIGVFEQADGGTLFLDELAEMPMDLQVKLLRVLETRQIKRVGGSKSIDVNVRILVATNRQPRDAVLEGKLREDLMYRLFVFPIDLPPLRDRAGDVRLLAQEFLDGVNRERGGNKCFAEQALQCLEAHTWPGNVRELANVVRRAYIMAADERITVSDLPLPGVRTAGVASARATTSGVGVALDIGVVLGMSIAAAEKLLIEATLVDLDDDKRQAAKVLGISLKTLYTRLQVYAAGVGVES